MHRTSIAIETRRHARLSLLLLAGISALLLAALAPPRTATATAATSGEQRSLSNLRMVNYFPPSSGWGSMWRHWNPGRLSADFARIRSLNANAVRIIVSAPAFGFPQPSAAMLSRLSQTVGLAGAAGLRVQLTLFDEWRAYADVADSKAWAAAVIGPLRGSPQIAYVDLRNELPAATNRAALAWAQAMVPFTQAIDGGIPVTVSTSINSGPGPLQALVAGLAAHPPDLYDVHYYGKAADAYPILAAAKRLAAPAPLYVGETGFATDASYGWATGLQPAPRSLESYQDYYFRTLELDSRTLGLAPAAPWILYDMPGQGGTRWGFHMGILHAGGAPKPAARAIARAFAGQALDAGFDNGFEQAAGHPALPALWRRWLPRAARFSVDRTVARSGRASARIELARGDHTVGCPAFYTAPIAAVLPGVLYTTSAWARGRGARGKSRVVLVWTDAAGRYLASSDSASLPPGDSGWTQLRVSAQPPPGAAAVEIDLQVCEDPGTTWFDDVGFSPSL